jgi:hypothetical protein
MNFDGACIVVFTSHNNAVKRRRQNKNIKIPISTS